MIKTKAIRDKAEESDGLPGCSSRATIPGEPKRSIMTSGSGNSRRQKNCSACTKTGT